MAIGVSRHPVATCLRRTRPPYLIIAPVPNVVSLVSDPGPDYARPAQEPYEVYAVQARDDYSKLGKHGWAEDTPGGDGNYFAASPLNRDHALKRQGAVERF